MIKLVATDLDGTFLKNDQSISSTDLNTLHALKDKGIHRVIATGRNLKKVRAVMPPEIPFDFIIYSSGAGIFDCARKENVYCKNLSNKSGQDIAEFLCQNEISFNAYHAVPENHQLWYYRTRSAIKEFDDYFKIYNSHAVPFPDKGYFSSELCQFLIMLPNDEVLFYDLKQRLMANFEDIGIIRTSSPLLSGNIWMEIFHQSVSKGNAVNWLCEFVGISQNETLGIGNDYNDIELLDYTNFSYLAANGPEELKSDYFAAPTNEEDAFTFAVDRHLI